MVLGYGFYIIFFSLFGLIIGSFLNVCIYRIPRADNFYLDEDKEPNENVQKEPSKKFNEPKRSICPKCENQLLWWHNIPVISWLLLGGKCYFCKSPISFRYVSVELLTLILALLTVTTYGFNITSFLIFFFCCTLLVISFIDYDFYIIPNVITYPVFLIGVVISAVNHFTTILPLPFNQDLYGLLFGLLIGAGFLYLISEVYLKLRKKEGLGMGDVKLLAMVGSCFGPECAFYTIFLGSIIGSFLGILFLLFKGKGLGHHLPFGPYLALGTLLHLFVGPQIIKYVINIF